MDHFGEVGEVGVAVGATLDEADAGVDAFGQGVGQVEVDGVQDAVAVAAQPAGEGDERVDSAAFGSVDPAAQVVIDLGGGQPVKLAEIFFELPGPVQAGVFAAQ